MPDLPELPSVRHASTISRRCGSAGTRPSTARLVIWLQGFTGTKSQCCPTCGASRPLAWSRSASTPGSTASGGSESREELFRRVFGAFRQHMWPILGQTALDVLRVVDWSVRQPGS